ncbi:MAG: hypothetical protein K9M49_03290 [Candidatus Marinimicrobia bacterium]|nr:hypothetical protein [Candidatus Neomarinimicrobiota bacterium]MCF7850889.1 hypothetical protein [Candidatus Neomarinimicrobiota bacterium]MCF7904158.1 hypothetical protein [Candidatus Neomarinimicrobiota bacterium]
MNTLKKLNDLIKPGAHLVTSILISALTSAFAFRTVEMEEKTLFTFLLFYVFLAGIILVFILQNKILDPRTRQLMQFSFLLLGSVLMLTGILFMIGRSLSIAAVFILIIFLPGLAILRAGLHLKNSEE